MLDGGVAVDKIRLMIVEDEKVLRKSLVTLLGMEKDIEVVGEAGDGKTAVSRVGEQMPDIVLMDINLPEMDGIQATSQIKRDLPKTGVVVLTVMQDDASLFNALKAGATGYILKDSSPEEIVEAIRSVHRGEGLLPPGLVPKVLQEFARVSHQKEELTQLFTQLSHREIEVLQHLARGKRNREIAEELYISEKTVKNHLSNIFLKLQVNDRTEAALLAMKHGLVER